MNNNYYITPEEIDIAVEGLLNKLKDKMKDNHEIKMKKFYGSAYKTSSEREENKKRAELLNKDLVIFKSDIMKNKSKIQAIINNVLKNADLEESIKKYITVMDNNDIDEAWINPNFIDHGASITLFYVDTLSWYKDTNPKNYSEVEKEIFEKLTGILNILGNKKDQLGKILGYEIEIEDVVEVEYYAVNLIYHPKVREED